MNPTIVIDLETTGLFKYPHRFTPRIIEIGAVFVNSDGEICDTFERVVFQDEKHLRSIEASAAFELSDLTPDFILENGIPENVAAVEFYEWRSALEREHGRIQYRAYNQNYDFKFLQEEPWLLNDNYGRCIMLESMWIMRDTGLLKIWPNGEYKWPKSREAEKYYASLGFDMTAPGLAHRALRDAIVEAKMVVAIERIKSNRRNNDN